MSDYKLKSDEYHKAMIDAKATGEHEKANYYYERYMHYKNKAESKALYPDQLSYVNSQSCDIIALIYYFKGFIKCRASLT